MDLHFKHVDWQRQYGEVVARAENVSIGDRRGDLVSGVELAVRPGDIIRFTGDPAACTAMLAAFGARLIPHTGSIYVFDISSRDEASRVIARSVFLDDLATQIPQVSKPMLLLVNRPLREVEKARVQEILEAGGALLLGPENTDEFANEDSYEVRVKLAVNG